jgi:hypothetical protein
VNKSYEIFELPGDVQRQYINARQVFKALRETEHAAKAFEGNMFWRTRDRKEYLIRTSRRGTQTGLGSRSSETEAIYNKFQLRKADTEERLAQLSERMKSNIRLNRALLVGRVDNTIINVLNGLYDAGLEDHLTVIGTNALYAYEAGAGVRVEEQHLATEDLDLLWDNRKKLTVAIREKITDSGLLGILKRVDKSFQLLRPTQLYTAVNNAGYQVDIIRRLGPGSDQEPAQLTNNAEDFWAVRARNADWLLSAPKFESIIVGGNGNMCKMVTVDPRAFALFKVWMAREKDRDPVKKLRDVNQAKLVVSLIQTYLPQLRFEDITVFPGDVRELLSIPAGTGRSGSGAGS